MRNGGGEERKGRGEGRVEEKEKKTIAEGGERKSGKRGGEGEEKVEADMRGVTLRANDNPHINRNSEQKGDTTCRRMCAKPSLDSYCLLLVILCGWREREEEVLGEEEEEEREECRFAGTLPNANIAE